VAILDKGGAGQPRLRKLHYNGARQGIRGGGEIVRRRSAWRTGRGGGTFRGVAGLMVAGLGIGVLILVLLRRTRGDVREKAERVSEAAQGWAKEHAGTSSKGSETRGAVEGSADQEGGAESAEGRGKSADEEREEEATGEHREDLRNIIRESVRRSEESSADQEEKGAAEGAREELRGIIRESVRRSEGSSSDREEDGAGGTAEETGRTTKEETEGERVTVVGVLAKMGEGFQETGGGKYILSSEDEGNFDLRGKEEELDDVYQKQIRANVTGRVTEEDAQPKIMEVDEVRPA
jgi:hypothetical protein